jgi:hypothetical protein
MRAHGTVADLNREKACDAEVEWRITMLFYAAVHAVNHHKFGGTHAPATFDHTQRRAYIDATLPALAVSYKKLENLSRTSRYLAQHHPMGMSEVGQAERLCDEVLRGCGLTPKG